MTVSTLPPEVAMPPVPALVERKEVAFIDTGVADWQTLVAGVRPGVEVVLLNAGESGLVQMAAWAETHGSYDAIHVLSHGSEGALQLGRDTLNAQTLAEAGIQAGLATLGQALKAEGDLLVYGCNVASGEAGQTFVANLAAATGADVAASDDATGAYSLGGDWTLEVETNDVSTTSLEIASYMEKLAAPVLQSDTAPSDGHCDYTVAVFKNSDQNTTYDYVKYFMNADNALHSILGIDITTGGYSWSVTSGPSHGTLVNNLSASSSPYGSPGGTLHYVPTAGYTGTDALTVQVTGPNGTDSMSVSINVIEQHTIGGTAATGNLWVTVTGGQIYTERHNGTAWEKQFFSSSSALIDLNGTLYALGPYYTFDASGSIQEAAYVSQTATSSSVVTTWNAGGVSIAQTVTLPTATSQYVKINWSITNNTGSDISNVHFLRGLDSYLSGGDQGSGFWDAATNTVGATKVVGGVVQRLGFQGITTPNSYASKAYGDVNAEVTDGGTLSNTIDATATIDNGYALEWSEATLSNGETWLVKTYESFVAAPVTVAGGDIENSTGGAVTLTFTVSNRSGSSQSVTYSATLPSGWSAATLSTTSETIANNGISTVTVTVDPPNSASSDVYDIILTAATTGGDADGVGQVDLAVPSNTTPTISDVANQTTNEGTATSALAVTIGDTETAATSLTLAGVSSDTTLIPNGNIVLGGSGANRTVTITPASNQTGTATITLTVTDGNSATATDTFTVTVSDVDPAITAGQAFSIAENSTAGAAVGTAAKTGDTDGLAWSITGGTGQSLFEINSGTGAITVKSGATFDYETTTSYTLNVAVDDEDGDTTADSTASVTVNITNANDAPALGGTVGTTWTENASYTTSPAAYSGNSVLLFASPTLADPDTTSSFNGATLTVSLSAYRSGDLISLPSSYGTVTYVQGTGAVSVSGTQVATLSGGSQADMVLTFNASATKAAIEAVMGAVTYTIYANDSPTAETRTVTATFNDKANANTSTGALTGTLTGNLVVSATNDTPTLTATAANPTYTENGAAQALFSGASISTVETGQNIAVITLTVGNLADGTSEILVVDGTDVALTHGTTGTTTSSSFGYSISVSGSTATVTLTKTDTAANWQTLVDGLKYKNGSENPTTAGGRTVTLTSIADSGGTANSGVDTATLTTASSVTISATNDVPTLANLSGDTVSYSVGGSAVTLDSGTNATVSDVDSANFNGGNVTVSITANGQAAEDELSISNQGSGAGQIGVSGSNVTYGGVTIGTFAGGSGGSNLIVTLNTSATPTAVQALVRALTYNDADGSTTNTAARTVRVTVNDGQGTSSNPDVTVNLVRAPILFPLDTGNDTTASFTEGTPVNMVSSASAADDGTFKALKVTLTSRPDGNGVESLTVQGGSGGSVTVGSEAMSYTYTAATGILLVTVDDGSTDATTFQNLIKAIRYNNSSENPTTTDRTVTFAGQDNDDNWGSDTTITVTVAGVNDAPTVGTNAGLTLNEGATATLGTAVLSISDVDTAAASRTLTIGTAPANGTLYKSGVAMTTGSTFTQADIAANAITYTHNGGETTADSFTFTVSDGAGGSISATTFNLTVTAVNDAPTLTGLTATGYVFGTAVKVLDSSLTIGDAELDALNSGNGSYNGAQLVLRRQGGANAQDDFDFGVAVTVTGANLSLDGGTTTIATYTEVGGTLTISFASGGAIARAQAEALMEAVAYRNTGSTTGDVTLEWKLYDSSGTGGVSVTQTQVITLSDNTAPAIGSNGGGATASTNVAENGTTVTTVTATDANADTVTYSLTGGADQAKFSLNASTGVLTFTTAPNYEVPTDADSNNSYIVEVTADDGQGGTDTQTLTVSVTDANESPTIGSNGGGATAAVSVAENGTAVSTVTATDVDAGATQTYSLTGGADQAKFSLNASTGVLSFTTAPNYEVPTDADSNNSYVVQVQVSDGTNTDTQTLTVSVTDANESPIIGSNGGGATAAVSVAENGTAVSTVTATDVDAGATQTYSLTGGADQAKFSLNASTGVLSFTTAPNYEVPTDADSNNSYVVEITADDGQGGTDTQILTVSVTDIDETPPPPAPDPVPAPGPTPPPASAPTGVPTGTFDGVTIDAATETTTTGTTVTTVTIPVVTSSRQDDPGTILNTHADIPLARDSQGETLLEVSIPNGVGMSVESIGTSGGSGGSTPLTLREILIAASDPRIENQTAFQEVLQNGIDAYVPTVVDEAQVTVRTVTLTTDPLATQAPDQPIIITGAEGTGEDNAAHPLRQEALVIDTRFLPSGSTLQLDTVEFAIVVGSCRVTGGDGRNFAVGDDGSQFFVLGADDDVLYGGGGNDTVASKGGNDQLHGDEGDDRVVGGDGSDTLYGGDGDDILQGGQSDAGTWAFRIGTDGEFETTYTAMDAAIAALPVWTVHGAWISTNGLTTDTRIGFLAGDATRAETVSLLYHAVMGELPTAEALNFFATGGLDESGLAQLAYETYQTRFGPQAQAIESQVANLIDWVWGAGAATAEWVTAGTEYILGGGSWADGLLLLARHTLHRNDLLTTDGALNLTRTYERDETGWSIDSGSDVLYGGTGNDTLVGGRGNDVIDGGAGNDFVTVIEPRVDHVLGIDAAGHLTVTRLHPGDVFTDALVDVETLTFSDVSLDVSCSNLDAGLMRDVAALHRLMTGAAPSLAELNAFEAAAGTLAGTAAALLGDAGYTALWAGLGEREFVSHLAEEVAGAPIASSDVDYWVARLDTDLSRDEAFLIAIGIQVWQDGVFANGLQIA